MSRPIYQKQIVPTYFECDRNNRMKLSSLLKHMQQMGSEHLDSLGLDYERLAGEGFVFLLSKIGMRFERMPATCEPLLVETEPKFPKGVQFLRNMNFYTLAVSESLPSGQTPSAGQRLVQAQTAWVVVDPESHKIVRPSAFPHDLHYDTDLWEDWMSTYRIKAPVGLQKVGEREVRYSDIDCNGHLNNAVYADIVYDFLPDGVLDQQRLREFYIIFHHEALLHQRLEIFLTQTGEKSYYLCAQVGSGKCFEAQLLFWGE